MSASFSMRNIVLSAVSLLSALPLADAFAQQPPGPENYPYGPHMMGWGSGWYGMIFGPIFMILMLAGVIAVTALLLRWLGGPWHGTQAPHSTQSGRTALDILKERYARGEIDKDEFEERRRVLGE